MPPKPLKMLQVILNNDYIMPSIGIGCLNERKRPGAEIKKIVKAAIDVGYRYINCPWEHREVIGRAIRDKIVEGVIKREDIFIAVKSSPIDDCNMDRTVFLNCQWTLKKMRLEYLDLLVVHSSDKHQKSKKDFTLTWHSMQECVEKGLVRSLGCSNFSIDQLKDILRNAQIYPVVNMMELHVNCNPLKMRMFCTSNLIMLVAYSPFGTAGNIVYASKECDYLSSLADLRSDYVRTLAVEYKKTNHQIVLRYLIQHGIIPTPSITSKEHLEENLNIFDFQLTDESMSLLNRCNSRVIIRKCCVTSTHKCEGAYFPVFPSFSDE